MIAVPVFGVFLIVVHIIDRNGIAGLPGLIPQVRPRNKILYDNVNWKRDGF
jgi:hypothetical protein